MIKPVDYVLNFDAPKLSKLQPTHKESLKKIMLVAVAVGIAASFSKNLVVVAIQLPLAAKILIPTLCLAAVLCLYRQRENRRKVALSACLNPASAD